MQSLVRLIVSHAKSHSISRLASRAYAALIVASLMHLLHHSVIQGFLELPAIVLASSVAGFYQPTERNAQLQDPLANLALVGLDESAFGARYEGTSPLNRCKLHGDLLRLLSHSGLQTLAVDFDLSPSLRRSDAELQCQKLVDALLDRYGEKLILLMPFDQEAAKAWIQGRKAAGVTFADGRLSSDLGIVRRHSLGHGSAPSFGAAIAERIDLSAEPGEGHADHFTISFRELDRLHAGGQISVLRDGGVILPSLAPNVRHVLFGPNYGSDDQFLTVIGHVPGMLVHAAIASSPKHKESSVFAFVGDVVIGIFFGSFISFCWHRYYDSRVKQATASLAYLWLVLLFAGVVLMTGCLTLLGALLFAWVGAWFSPVGMALGMLLDSVVDGIESAVEKMNKPLTHAPCGAVIVKSSPFCEDSSVKKGLVLLGSKAPSLIGLSIVVNAVSGLIFG